VAWFAAHTKAVAYYHKTRATCGSAGSHCREHNPGFQEHRLARAAQEVSIGGASKPFKRLIKGFDRSAAISTVAPRSCAFQEPFRAARRGTQTLTDRYGGSTGARAVPLGSDRASARKRTFSRPKHTGCKLSVAMSQWAGPILRRATYLGLPRSKRCHRRPKKHHSRLGRRFSSANVKARALWGVFVDSNFGVASVKLEQGGE